MKKIIVICGPTASGKTQLAHFLAKKNNGEIINADSMQLYKQLPIITASPELELKNELSYHLYNFLDVESEYSVAKYASVAATKIREISARGKVPILVGGSGMYINALINGFSYIPDIDHSIRKKIRELQKSLSSEKFFIILQQVDPEITKILHMQDSQRIARAYEVYMQTGKSITFYQKNKIKFLEGFCFDINLLIPERQFLYSMCNLRLEQMFENGAIEEVALLITENKNIQSSAIKALGVQEIISYLQGNISKNEALENAKIKTRRYAKRQLTWFKNQLPEKNILSFSNHTQYKEIFDKIKNDDYNI